MKGWKLVLCAESIFFFTLKHIRRGTYHRDSWKHSRFLYSFKQRQLSPWSVGVLTLRGNNLLWSVRACVQSDWEGTAGGGWGRCGWKWRAAALHGFTSHQTDVPQSHMLITYQGQGAHASANMTSYRAECAARTHERHQSTLRCDCVQLYATHTHTSHQML